MKAKVTIAQLSKTLKKSVEETQKILECSAVDLHDSAGIHRLIMKYCTDRVRRKVCLFAPSPKHEMTYDAALNILDNKLLKEFFDGFRKDNNVCESCGTDKWLQVHHKDQNHFNNVYSNLARLCQTCHFGLHRKLPKVYR